MKEIHIIKRKNQTRVKSTRHIKNLLSMVNLQGKLFFLTK